jgi:DNA-binding PadR family transcriptional regulator
LGDFVPTLFVYQLLTYQILVYKLICDMSKTSNQLTREELLEYLPLTPAVFHILLSLSAGEQHGYAIMKDVAEQTDGEFKLGPGKLYYSIQRLLDEGLIEELEPPRGHKPERGRRTYRLADLGHDLLEAEARRLKKAVRLVRTRRLLRDVDVEGDTA